ncbi:YciI family protein [Aestuariibacter sp. A3R04]|uniref:YciI family protein n=1 Tax=Aestuariibacter sp. A3R04 TaxID=2841571 RepID=UPI001C0A1FD3|nr:YciI family protein [Aestuariibacter sp. A3R04]MBU3023527.1 YciI family protein [Aestuariibacter sp. A3R04]
MLFCIQCRDNGNQEKSRLAYLNEHLSWVSLHLEVIKVAGPLRDKKEKITGSLYVLEAGNESLAMQFIQSDPYYQADIWHHVSCDEFSAYAGEWVGGKNWPGSTTNDNKR